VPGSLVTATEMPFSRKLNALGTEIVYDSGDYPRLLDKALAKIGWDSLQTELRRRRAAGELVGGRIRHRDLCRERRAWTIGRHPCRYRRHRRG
jgi:hypothetical protein